VQLRGGLCRVETPSGGMRAAIGRAGRNTRRALDSRLYWLDILVFDCARQRSL
jgi:hypothetical protein